VCDDFGSNDKVTFIFAVFIVHDQNHFSLPKVFKDFFCTADSHSSRAYLLKQFVG